MWQVIAHRELESSTVSKPPPVPERAGLILPINRHIPRAAAGYCVLVVRSVLPGHVSVGGDLDELELYLRASRQGRIEKPVRIVWVEHRTNRRIEGRAPIPQLNRTPRQKDVIPWVRRSGVIHGERDRDKLSGQHGKLNRVGRRS